jgi:hypothetical protein
MWAAIWDWLRSWEAVHAEVDCFADRGDRVLVLTRQTGRGRRSDVPLDKELADFFTVRDGRIVRWESYWDRAEALKAAGLTEEELKPFQRPSLTRRKLRALELKVDAGWRHGRYSGPRINESRKDRAREAEFARQAEIAYRRLVADWQLNRRTGCGRDTSQSRPTASRAT